MRLVLKEFQERALHGLLIQLQLARNEVEAVSQPQSLTLSSPTGSGKTVIVTALIESLIDGTADHPPDPHATFLWITDQPELNEQTRNKMTMYSTRLWMGGLEIIETGFDQPLFDAGKTYFLNTQKLGKEKNLITYGDNRTHTIWETITNTVIDRPASFYVILDEAHRGMKETTGSRKQAESIVQKFIKGSPGEIPAVPLIVGMSATPDRFQKLLAGTGRTTRSHDVAAEDVRESGLLKQTITLWHPTESQPGDITMLREAALDLRRYTSQWNSYCEAQGELPVRPILVVQVEDGSGKNLSNTAIGRAIDAINDAIGPLDAQGFAHAFEEHSVLDVDGHDLRYLASAAIDADPDVQVVFFKSALNTGWDCPRAEVMMSFRKAKDATLIAQLVGRMVRTPLARPVGTSAFLNSVNLYLPHYDSTGLDKVIEYLTAADSDTAIPTDVQRGSEHVDLELNADLDSCVAALASVPSYVIPRSNRVSEVRRMMRLARLLSNTAIYADAPHEARSLVTGHLIERVCDLQEDSEFVELIKERSSLEIGGRSLSLEDDSSTTQNKQLTVSRENIRDLFESAGRTLGEGLHRDFLQARCVASDIEARRARLELVALMHLSTNEPRTIESMAQNQVHGWNSQFRKKISLLDDGDRQRFEEVLRMGGRPVETRIDDLPTQISARSADTCWASHLYINPDGLYPADLNSWERAVLEAELNREDVVGWLRNPPRKDWSFCVPYEHGSETKPVYPDFLIFRSEGDSVVVDLLDPHSESLSDAADKARGLAQYAKVHGIDVGRVELISVKANKLRRLDLQDEKTRNAVLAISTSAQLSKLFDDT